MALLGADAVAESPRSLVRRGNRAFEAGRYDEAMKAYEQADVEAPESPVVAFNQGTVHYRAEDFAAARAAFEKAARASHDPRFEAMCRYNLGNCWFREVRRQMDSDLGKAVEACERSVDEYQAALALDPTLDAARRNIEVVRRLWKSILDEQKRRQEQQDARQEEARKLLEQLRQLIERQEQAARQSEDLARRQTAQGSTPEVQQQAAAQAAGQRQLGQDTQSVLENLRQAAAQAAPQQPPPQTPGAGAAPDAPPQHPAIQHMADARQAQDRAADALDQTRPAPAGEDQKRAADHLRKALESLAQPQQEQPTQGSQQAQQQQQQQPAPQQGQDSANQNEDDAPQNGQKGQDDKNSQQNEKEAARQSTENENATQPEEPRQQARARLADQDARDILDTEKRNRERRTAAEQRALAPVDKDW